MKITTTAGILSELLGRVARAVSSRSTMAILSGVLLRAEKGEGDAPGVLTMAATDMEISLTLVASAPVEEAGSAVVPAKVLLQYARSLPKNAPVTLTASPKDSTATLASEKSTVTLRCYAPDDFPTPPAFPKEGAFSVPAKSLAESIDRVLPFASKDETRPVLTGVFVEFAENSARMVATDSYRLGLDEAALEGASADAGSAVVPARGLKEASRLAALGTETVEVSLTQNACAFSVGSGSLVLTTRLIEGSFPEYRRLLPDAFAHTFRTQRGELAEAISRVRLLAGENPPTPVTVRFHREEGTLGEGELAVSLSNQDAGAAAEIVPASLPEGTDFSACFNPGYLADAVASVGSTAVDFCFNDPLKPAVIRAHAVHPNGTPDTAGEPQAAEGKSVGHLCMVMPMRDPSA